MIVVISVVAIAMLVTSSVMFPGFRRVLKTIFSSGAKISTSAAIVAVTSGIADVLRFALRAVLLLVPFRFGYQYLRETFRMLPELTWLQAFVVLFLSACLVVSNKSNS